MELLNPRERGLTLVETLVALLILALVAISILGLFTHGIQLNASGADYTNLTNVAKDKLEELRNLPFRHPDLDVVGTHSRTLADRQLLMTWTVQEFQLNAGNETFENAVGAGAIVPDPITGVAAQEGNFKVITLTVASQRQLLLGRRDVTVQSVKTIRQSEI